MSPPTVEQVMKLIAAYGDACGAPVMYNERMWSAWNTVEEAVKALASDKGEVLREAVAVSWRTRIGSKMAHLCPEDRAWTMCARYLAVNRVAAPSDEHCRSCKTWLKKNRGV